MDKLRDQYEAQGMAAIDKVKLTDDVAFEVTFGVVPANGEAQPGWWFLVTLKHNRLLGLPPIAAPNPVGGVLLHPNLVATTALGLLEAARQQRDKMNSAPAQAQGLPAGLVK